MFFYLLLDLFYYLNDKLSGETVNYIQFEWTSVRKESGNTCDKKQENISKMWKKGKKEEIKEHAKNVVCKEHSIENSVWDPILT